jgi:hypothetical protein
LTWKLSARSALCALASPVYSRQRSVTARIHSQTPYGRRAFCSSSSVMERD